MAFVLVDPSEHEDVARHRSWRQREELPDLDAVQQQLDPVVANAASVPKDVPV